MSPSDRAPGPTISGLDVQRAKRYSRIKLTLHLSQSAAATAQLAWFALSGRSAALRSALDARLPSRHLTTPGYLAVTSVAAWALSLPLSAVRDLVVERRFGLTYQTASGWAGDQLKGLAVALVIGVPMGTAAYGVIRRRPRDWWLVIASATVPVSVALSHLAPLLILPLFNRFERLTDAALTERIERLAARAGFDIAAVYRMDMSRQTEKPNAFFTGLGRTKRIVLGDTLSERFPPEEVEAVVAHELGHQAYGDVWRFIAMGSATGYGVALAAHRLAPELMRRTAPRTGVGSVADVAGAPLLGLVLLVAAAVVNPLLAAVSRSIERRTDRYAIDLTGDPRTYATALTRLAAASLIDPTPPRLVVLFASHPPIAERIAAAERLAASSRPKLARPDHRERPGCQPAGTSCTGSSAGFWALTEMIWAVSRSQTATPPLPSAKRRTRPRGDQMGA